MGHNWEIVKLSEVLQLNIDSVDVLSQPEFYFAGVYCFGGGLFKRGLLNGENTSYKTYNRLHKNQIVVSKVKGWEGAIALVTDEYDGMFLSPVYPTFSLISDTIADLSYIHLFLQQKEIWQKLFSNSKGIGARRNSISEVTFLNLLIPLPPLTEQKRIVEKIESVQKRLERIKQLRAEQEKEIGNIRYSLMTKLESDYTKVVIYSVCNLQKGSFPIMKTEAGNFPFVVTGEEFKTANAYDFDCAATCVPLISSTGHGNAAMHRVHYANGKFALSNLLCAVIPKDDNKVNAKYLYELFMAKKDEYFVPLMAGTSNVSLNIDRLGNVEIPLPPITEQNRIVAFLEKVNQIQLTFKVQEAELSNLLPALLDKAFKGELFDTQRENQRPDDSNIRLFPKLTNRQEAVVKIYSIEDMAILAGYIIMRNKGKDFGRVKLIKLLFLIEYHCQLEVNKTKTQYFYQDAAGPHNEEYRKEIESILNLDRYYESIKKPTKSGKEVYQYQPLENENELPVFFQSIFTVKQKEIKDMIALFRKESWKTCEIVATLYAVWNNRILVKQKITDEELVKDFFKWSKHKRDYTKEEVIEGLRFMNKNSIIPDGFGKYIDIKAKDRFLDF